MSSTSYALSLSLSLSLYRMISFVKFLMVFGLSLHDHDHRSYSPRISGGALPANHERGGGGGGGGGGSMERFLPRLLCSGLGGFGSGKGKEG